MCIRDRVESAVWLPAMIRGKARRFSLVSEAASRFEKGVDPETLEADFQIICNLIFEIAGGTSGNVYFENGVKFAGTTAKTGKDIRVYASREASISGVNVPVARTVRVDEDIQASTTTTQTITAEPDVNQPSTFTTAPAPTSDPTSTPTSTPTVDPTPSSSPSPSPSPDTGGGGG